MRALSVALASLLLFSLLGCGKARSTRSAEDELRELAIKFYTAATFEDWSACMDEGSAKMFSRAAWEMRTAFKREDIKITGVNITGDAAVIHCESPTGKKWIMRSLWAARKDAEWLLTFGKAEAPLHKSRLGAAREGARRAHCISNLKQTAYACERFSKDNNGKLPGTFEVMLSMGIDKRIFSCPSRRGEMDYVYVPGLEPGDPPDCILAYDKEGNHEGGRNVLFLDKNVKWMTEEAFQTTLEKTRRHIKAGGSTTE